MGGNYEIAKIRWWNFKKLSSREPRSQFQPNLALCILGLSGLKLFKWRAKTFSNNKNALWKFKKLLLQNHWANFIQTSRGGTIFSLVKLIHIRIFIRRSDKYHDNYLSIKNRKYGFNFNGFKQISTIYHSI